MQRLWPVIGVLLVVMACSKQKEIIVPDNTAPPDHTISDLVVENYVNRCYISLLGYRPNDAEMNQGKSTLRANNLSAQNRSSFLDQVMAKPAYPMRLFDIGRALLINSTDTVEIRNEVILMDLLLADSGYIMFWPLLQTEKAKLLDVLAIPSQLAAGTIDVKEMHRRLIFNRVYDQINMGTQNFVVSVFQNFLFRYPTEAERIASETMVDGFNSQVFLETGRTKADFIGIFFRSRDYAEGQVRDLFLRHLYREPKTQELESLSIQFRGNGDYKALQKAVLSKNEFVGI